MVKGSFLEEGTFGLNLEGRVDQTGGDGLPGTAAAKAPAGEPEWFARVDMAGSL